MEKTFIIVLPVILALLISAVVASRVQADDDILLAQAALHLDYKADKTGWPTVVFDQLKNEFNVSDARIYSLREKNLSYGEIATVLSLAEQMPGGINDRNVQKVVTLRRGSGYQIGWASVAKALEVRVSRAVDHAQAINESSWSANTQSLPRAGLDSRDVKHSSWSDGKASTQLQSAPRLEEGMKPGN
jgi:hypothetical protein